MGNIQWKPAVLEICTLEFQVGEEEIGRIHLESVESPLTYFASYIKTVKNTSIGIYKYTPIMYKDMCNVLEVKIKKCK